MYIYILVKNGIECFHLLNISDYLAECLKCLLCYQLRLIECRFCRATVSSDGNLSVICMKEDIVSQTFLANGARRRS